jgi:CII-binding regulator of phage lambda lysogenization HflD
LPELVSFSWCAPFLTSPCGHYNTCTSQAAKDIRGDRDTLIDIFERIESFFRRLEIYADVPPSTEMMDTITQIMVDVISVLGLATKEIKQGRMSE